MRTKNLVWICFTLLLALSTTAILPAKAQAPRVYVDPPEIIDPTKTPGTSFIVNINIQGGSDVYTWAFVLSWDPAMLNVTDVTEGPYLIEVAPEGTFLIDKRYQEAGYIDEACSILGPYPGQSGDGTLLTVTFLVEKVGETLLHLSDAVLIDSATPPNTTYPEVTDGFFANRETAPADLAGRSAWPERHHHVIAKVGTTQTLYAKIRNLGTRTAAVKVVFTYTMDGGAGMVETTEQYLAVGEIRVVSTTLTVTPGKYQVVAQCWYRYYSDLLATGKGPWTPSDTKSFSFAVV